MVGYLCNDRLNDKQIVTLFMMKEPAGIASHRFLTLSPLGTAVLEPNLEGEEETFISLNR